MSEAERKKREEYRKHRKGWIIGQIVFLAVVAIIIAAIGLSYRAKNKTMYITYSEASRVDYKVHVTQNDFYEEEWLDANQAYVAALIDEIKADFSYTLAMEEKDVEYEYSYMIDAQLEIVDNNSKVAIYDPVYVLKDKQTFSKGSTHLSIAESVTLDYTTYNQLATNFINVYDLENTTSTLTVRLHINIIGSCSDFKDSNQNEYVVALSIPLTKKAVTINLTSNIPQGESKVLACDNGFNADAYKAALISFSVVEGVFLVVFLCFVYMTRNEDINYAIRIQKLVFNYKSYIQKINNGFDTDGYQLLAVDTFNEMLCIRDTIQSPILMSENRDKTRTLFLIPTNTKILYTYEIKVENYDELYKDSRPTEGAAILKEEISLAQEVAAEEMLEMTEELSEAPVEENADDMPTPLPESAVEEVAEEPIEAVEEAGVSAVEIELVSPEELVQLALEDDAHYRKYGPSLDYSFEAKLALSSKETREFYKQISDFIVGYGVRIVRSWKRERIYKGRNLFGLFIFRGSRLAVTLALDPTTLHPKYHAKDLSNVKKFAKTPTLMKITSERKVKYTVQLLKQLFVEAGIEDKQIDVKSKLMPQKSRKALFEKDLIRVKDSKKK